MNAPITKSRTPQLATLREPGMAGGILVTTITAAFGVVLVEATAYIGALLASDPYIGNSGTLAFVTGLLTVLLTAVAMYVAAIVTANTFATVIAGRTRQIALMRLIGASARSERARVARSGLLVGILGAALGLISGFAIAAGGVALAGQFLTGAPEDAVIGSALTLLPAAGVALTTWAAAHVGSRRVLDVTPLEAIGGAVEPSHDEVAPRPVQRAAALILLALGVVLLVLGVLAGLVTPLGIVVAFLGGLLSFTGLTMASTLIMPPVLRLVGSGLGKGATARLAAENALRYPERSSRMAIGVVMGVALVTMFAVALESTKAVLTVSSGGELAPEFEALVDAFATVMMALVGICAVIAAVGLVNLLTIGVMQRRRELGLLRAIGLSNRQIRVMILTEAAHITITATLTGLVLGIAYGWVAAQSLLGSIALYDEIGAPGLVAPHIPWIPVAVIAVAAAVLTLIASVAPTRLATRVAPVEALAAA